MAAALPVVAGIGAIGSLIQGNRAANQAQQGLNIQKQAAQNQQQLFGQASPVYNQLLGALQQNAGIGAPGSQMAQQILGQNATPADLARYQTLSQQLGQAGQQAMHNAQFDMGTRGLFGSNLDASQRAAIQSNLGLGMMGLRSQIMDEAQQNYANRLQQLYGALAPGLGAGVNAANIAGQFGQQAFGQQGVFGGQLAGALQNYLQYQALRPQRAPLSNYDFGVTPLQGQQAYSNFAGAGVGQTQDLGGGFSITT